MGKKDKKKGKGAEKTAAKTEKKAIHKAKKELAAKGEDDIEKLIAEFQEQDKKCNVVEEEHCSPPSPRSGFSLCAHPEKDELLFFGGEYYNGNKTFMYNDLYFYNIKKDLWSILHCSNKPPPRCAHQAVTVSQAGGQMWIFGGEFASPTRSNFHHYKDMWVFHITERRWECVKVTGGPSSRSGHRMVQTRKKLIVFGGFHETIRDYKYFNDVHIFDLETYQWTKVEPLGKGPCPRSGCQMAPLADGRILLYGGYNREKVKKDVDKGTSHTDMYFLQLDEKSNAQKWKWVPVKQTGIHPSPRSGFSIALATGNRAFTFGGVHDEEDTEESLTGVFHNDLYALEMDKGRWLPILLHGKMEKTDRKRRRKQKEDEDAIDEGDDSEENEECLISELNISEKKGIDQSDVQTTEDSVFTVKIGPQCSTWTQDDLSVCASVDTEQRQPFCPHPRMNAAIVVKHSILYLYGGLYEEGDKHMTLSDFYSLDLHKLDEWKILVASDLKNIEWFESDSDDDESEDDDDEMNPESSKDSSEDIQMDTG